MTILSFIIGVIAGCLFKGKILEGISKIKNKILDIVSK